MYFWPLGLTEGHDAQNERVEVKVGDLKHILGCLCALDCFFSPVVEAKCFIRPAERAGT